MKLLPESAIEKIKKCNGQINCNAGSGTDPKVGYVNYDFRNDIPEVDIVDDLNNIEDYFEENSVDNVICFQVLEHFRREDWRGFLAKCCRIIKPTGHIHIRVPSVEDLVEEYHRGHINAEQMIYTIYGRQEHYRNAPIMTDYHKSGFTIGIIKDELEKNGFFVEEINHVYGLGLLHVVGVKK